MGDFNEALNSTERRSASTITTVMRELGQCIHDLQLIDVDINLKYPRMRRNIARRIDRMLVETQFMETFPNIHAFYKIRLLSYHYPILLSSSQLP